MDSSGSCAGQLVLMPQVEIMRLVYEWRGKNGCYKKEVLCGVKTKSGPLTLPETGSRKLTGRSRYLLPLQPCSLPLVLQLAQPTRTNGQSRKTICRVPAQGLIKPRTEGCVCS